VSGALGAALLLAALGAGCRREPAERVERARPTEATPAAAAAPAGAAAARFPSPDRPVSRIISPRWSDEDARDDAGEADTVLALLGMGAGAVVADIGAGSGYYTVRAARRVGAGGRVYAEDITPRYVTELRERLRRERVENVTVVLGEPHDPRLPPGSADVALLVHMYHEVEQPYALLHNLAPALRPGGRVAILDLDRPTGSHGTPPALLRCELARAGYTERAFHSLGPGEYLAVFTPPAPGTVSPEQIAEAVRRAPCVAR
jgi:SAM-dependent methyltransferase